MLHTSAFELFYTQISSLKTISGAKYKGKEDIDDY
jgi:hypothetical protein